MLERRYYGHDTPEGKTVMDRIQARAGRRVRGREHRARPVLGRRKSWTGDEARSTRSTCSPPCSTEIGIGLAFGKIPGGYEILWVQDFGRVKAKGKVWKRASPVIRRRS